MSEQLKMTNGEHTINTTTNMESAWKKAGYTVVGATNKTVESGEVELKPVVQSEDKEEQ